MTRQPHILIIGGASVDKLRAAGQPVVTPGGGGLYTAVAARRAGAHVRFFAYRPDPLPALFNSAAEAVDWFGPSCRLEDIPHFEIVYDAAGDARLERATWGSEDSLDPSMVPDDALQADYIHIAAIHDPSLQIRFVQDLRKRTNARLSAGTFGYMVHRAPDAVRSLMESVDLFFLNGFEAEQVFGQQAPTVRPGQILVITRGADGSDVWQGDYCTRVQACMSTPVDLTGAGDSVCGGMLAGLLAGLHPTQAARQGAAVAAITIEAPGMAALLEVTRDRIESRRQPLSDGRVRVREDQVARMAQHLRGLQDIQPFDFTGPHLPAAGQPGTLDFLFASVLHQFGFWSPMHGAYAGPTYAMLNGQKLKGSDYCFSAFKRLLDHDPDQLSPRSRSVLRWSDTEAMFRSDDGSVPMPVLAIHHTLARGYGRDMWELGWTPEQLVEEANASADPVKFLVQALDHVTGYREDPLRKKTMLLVAALGQRPEKFIDLDGGRALKPIIDYHLMRSCLRTGLVEIVDPDLRAQIVARRLVRPAEEWAVRSACYQAVLELSERSGRDIGTIDWFFFGARHRCPEMREPECATCPVQPVCAQQREMFQPVLRTTFY